MVSSLINIGALVLAILLVANIVVSVKILQSRGDDQGRSYETFLQSLDVESVAIDAEGVILFSTDDFPLLLGKSQKPIGENITEVVPLGDEVVNSVFGSDFIDNASNSSLTMTDGGISLSSLQELPALRPHSMGTELITEVEGESKHYVIQAGDFSDFATDHHFLLFEDITDSRRTEVNLRSIIEYTSDFVAVLCSKGTVQTFKCSNSTPAENDQVIGTGDTLVDYIHPDEQNEFADVVDTVINERRPLERHFRVNLHTGKWVLFDLSIRNSGSNMCDESVIIIGDDISDERLFEQRRQVLSRVLRHNLRNDMNVICGHAELLMNTVDNAPDTHTETIYSKANELMDLAEKVRDIDQQLYGNNRQVRKINLTRMVKEEISRVHNSSDAVQFSYTLDNAPIIGNSLFRIAVRNLLENSIEHNDNDDPCVSVEIENKPKEHRVVLTISDNGPGIPEGEYRAITDGVETKLDHVSGVGLWLVKWVIDGVDGTISIEDNEPRGTSVSISLPSAESPRHLEALTQSDPRSSLEHKISTSLQGEPIRTSTRGD